MDTRLESLKTLILSSWFVDSLSGLFNTDEINIDDFMENMFGQLVEKFRADFPGFSGRVYQDWDNSTVATWTSTLESPYTFSGGEDNDLKIQVDNGPVVTITFSDGVNGTPAHLTATTPEFYQIDLDVNDILRLQIDPNPEFTVQLTPGLLTALDISNQINAAAGSNVSTTFTDGLGDIYVLLNGIGASSASGIYVKTAVNSAAGTLGWTEDDVTPLAVGIDPPPLFVLTADDVVSQINAALGATVASKYTSPTALELVRVQGTVKGSTGKIMLFNTANNSSAVLGFVSSDTIPASIGTDHDGKLYLNDIDVNLLELLMIDYSCTSPVLRVDTRGISYITVANTEGVSEAVAKELYTEFIQNEWSTRGDKPATMYDDTREEDYIMPLGTEFVLIYLKERGLSVNHVQASVWRALEAYIKFNMAEVLLYALTRKATTNTLSAINSTSSSSSSSGGAGISPDRISSISIGNLALSFSTTTGEDRLSNLLSAGGGQEYIRQLNQIASTNRKVFETEKFIRYGGMIR